MTWNYRLVRTQVAEGSCPPWQHEWRYDIRRVDYHPDGSVKCWAESTHTSKASSAQECRNDHVLRNLAFSRPVLDISSQDGSIYEVDEPTRQVSDDQIRDEALRQLADQYLKTAIDLCLPDHQHVLAAREDTDPNDDFTCPLCRFVTGLIDNLTHDGVPTSIMDFARQTPRLRDHADRERLAALAIDWVRAGLDRPILPRLPGAPSPEELGITVRSALIAALDRSLSPAQVIAQVWQGWTVHRVVQGARRNTTCVMSKDGLVALVRMQSWDFWVYALRGVASEHWAHKSLEERMLIIEDSVEYAIFASSVPKLLTRVSRMPMVNTKGTLYAERVKALAEREVKAAFPTGEVP